MMDEFIKRLRNGATLGKDVFIAANATVVGDVRLGDDTSVWYNVVLRADVNHIIIGNRTNIQDGTVIHVTTDLYPTVIGEGVTVGHGVMLHGCEIGDNSLIGIGSIILDGAKIGKNSIVAAGTVIPPRKKFPDNSFILGHPGSITRMITNEDIAGLIKSADKYVRYKNIYISEGIK